MRLGLVPSVVVLSLLLVVPSAPAADRSPGTAIAKKKKSKKCKKSKVALTVNGRKRCVPVKAALPRPKAGDPALLAAKAALGFDPGRLRDRRGRRVVSAAKLLGAQRVHAAEGAIKQGLATLGRLRADSKLGATSSLAGMSSLAVASAQGCAAQAKNPSQSAEFKGDGFDAKVDLGKGAAQIGIDLGEGGVRAEFDFGLCEKGDDHFQAPECPKADGTLEASDESNFYANIRIFKGGELLLSQNIEFTATTAIEPIQVDDDAKLEYFEIDHTYKTSIETGGSSQLFGKVSLKLAYHGSTRVNYPGATYDPTHTDVEVKFGIEGAQADDQHELRDIEFDQSLQAKPEADKNFAAAVDKAIAKLGEREARWLQPNVCAAISFDPVSDSLLLERDQPGGFRARIKSKAGGEPEGGKWTLTESQNAAVGPPRALANPAAFNYSVTNAGRGIEVQAALRVTSRAGVAEATWTQPTKEEPPPPPPPAAAFTGPISGTAVLDAADLGEGFEIASQWTGEVTLTRDPPIESPGPATYAYKLTSGSIAYSFTGSENGCHVQGGDTIDLGAQQDLTAGVSLVLLPGDPRPYQLILPSPALVQVPGTQSACEDPEDNGDSFDWAPAGGLPALVYALQDPGHVLAEDESFAGSGSGDFGPGSPSQTWAWDLAPVP
jgi:hypothetical protein